MKKRLLFVVLVIIVGVIAALSVPVLFGAFGG